MSTSRLSADAVAFTNFTVNENGDTTLEIKHSTDVVSSFDDTGMVFDNTGTELTATHVQEAIKEVNTLIETNTSVGNSLKFLYKYNNNTIDSDPGSGKVKFNNLNFAVVNTMYIDNIENAKGVDVRTLLLLATGDIRIYIQRSNDNSEFALWNANGIDSSEGGYLKFQNLTLIDSNRTIGGNKLVLLIISKRPGTEIRNVSIPALPGDGTGNYRLDYDSSTQAYSWDVASSLLPPTYSSDATTVTVNASGSFHLVDEGTFKVGTGDDLTISHSSGVTSFTNDSDTHFETTSGTGEMLFKVNGDTPFATVRFTNTGDQNIMNMGGDRSMIVHGYMNAGYSDFSFLGGTSRFSIWDSTFTDSNTASAGTLSLWASMRIRQQTLAAVGLNVTTSESASLYIDGPVIEGTNQTLASNHSILVNSGTSLFKDSTVSSSSGTGAVVVTGGVGIGGNLHVGGNLNASSIYSEYVFRKREFNEVTGAGQTYTMSDILAGGIIREMSSNITDAFPDAATIVAAMLAADPSIEAGASFSLVMVNNSGDHGDKLEWTVGGGVTFLGKAELKGSRGQDHEICATNIGGGTEAVIIVSLSGEH